MNKLVELETDVVRTLNLKIENMGIVCLSSYQMSPLYKSCHGKINTMINEIDTSPEYSTVD